MNPRELIARNQLNLNGLGNAEGGLDESQPSNFRHTNDLQGKRCSRKSQGSSLQFA
jgi:hypothetical protein